MKRSRRAFAILGLATLLTVGGSFAKPAQAAFNDEYVFATTKSLNDDVDMNPALKVTLIPVTVVLDTVFLPFAVVAGFVT